MPKSRKQFWFGTKERMQWVPLPNSGADLSPEGWGESGTLMNGGGYVRHSWGTHKNYQFEWPSSSSRDAAQLMKSYRDGSFGRGLIYFHDPLSYNINVLPARWADPSMAVREQGASLVYDTNPTGQTTVNWPQHNLPVQTAVYPVSSMPVGMVLDSALFIPIPPGMSLTLGAFYSSNSALAGVFVTEVDANGNDSGVYRLPPIAESSAYVVNNFVHGIRGVRLWVGKTSAAATGSVNLSGLVGRLIASPLFDDSLVTRSYGVEPTAAGPYAGSSRTLDLVGPWQGGQGHSGCRFDGPPTFVNYTGVNGGQVGYAASFKEVGGF